MKKILSLVTIILMIISMLGATAFADSHPPRLVDEAGLLDKGEAADVEDYLDRISENQNFDVVVVTVDGHSSSSDEAFCDDYYDYNGYGMGENYDGVILVINMEERSFIATTCGWGITALTDYGLEYIYDELEDYLKEGDWVGAFENAYADNVEEFVKASYNGKYFDDYGSGYDNYGNKIEVPETPLGIKLASGAGLAVVLGILNGLRSSQSKKAKLKSVRRKKEADSYVKPGSMHLRTDRERFLYKNLAVTEKPKPKSNSDGPLGGGSSIHISSSGRSHGGGGSSRKF